MFVLYFIFVFFFFSSRRRHTRFKCDWSSDVCSSDLAGAPSSRWCTSAVGELPENRLVSEAPVGIFDSGVGGLSVLREIRAAMPAESVCYVAPSPNAPWADNPPPSLRHPRLPIPPFLPAQL